MSLRKVLLTIVVFAVSFLAVGVCFCAFVPETMLIRWNIGNEGPDAVVSGTIGVFVLPLWVVVGIMPFLAVLAYAMSMTGIPGLLKYAVRFSLTVLGFALYGYVLMLLWSMGVRFVFEHFMLPALVAFPAIAGFDAFRTVWVNRRSMRGPTLPRSAEG
jgi:hypothetical protein